MREKECFVIMPFSDKENPLDNRWDDLFENNLKPAVDNANLGYKCIRALNPHGNFMRNIVNHLANAEVVIAVLTELRPNVMYELGVRNALRRRTIMIAEKGSLIPSDLNAFIALYYSIETKQGRDALTKVIQERLAILDSEEPESDNPVSDYLWKRAQDICDDWRDKKDPQTLVSRITDVLPSYAFQLGLLLNQVGQHLTYSQIEQSVRASLTSSDTITEVKTAGKGRERSEKEISEVLATVADKTMEAIREESFLTIDTRPLLGNDGDIWQLPYVQFLSISSLLDYVWSSMRQHIESMNYGVSWVLRDAASGKVFKDAGRTWAKKNTGVARDDRPLASVGMKPGMKLDAIPLPPAA
jgi:hypothetical protein